MNALRRHWGWLLWPLAITAVLAHLGLVVLAVVEWMRLGWLASEPYELAAVILVAVSGLLSVVGGASMALGIARVGRGLRLLLRAAAEPVPLPVQAAAESLGIAGRVDVVMVHEPFAVVRGLLHPRILLTTGLLRALDRAELATVLVHERQHLRERDPLRLSTALIVASYVWYLPLLGRCTRWLLLRQELAADRAAAAGAGPAAVVAVLRKLAARRRPEAIAGANLPARIARLEGRRPAARRTRSAWLQTGATVLNLGWLGAAAICCARLGLAMMR